MRQHVLEHIRRKGNTYIIYTDGSKSNTGVGAASVFPDSVTKIGLPLNTSVFTAELTALEAALGNISSANVKSVTIFSDSRSALDAINQFSPKNHLVRNIQQKIHQIITSGCKIEICWIPAHIGIKGNEEADQAAKEASSLNITVKEIPIGDWISSAKPLIFQDWQTKWDHSP